jgi:hypothetical protein
MPTGMNAHALGRVRVEVGFRDIVAVLLDRATMVCLPQPLYGWPVIRPSDNACDHRLTPALRCCLHDG